MATIVVFIEKEKIMNCELPQYYDIEGNEIADNNLMALCLAEDTANPILPTSNIFDVEVYYIQHNAQVEKNLQIEHLKTHIPSSSIYNSCIMFSHIDKDDIWESIRKVLQSETSTGRKNLIESLVEKVKQTNLRQALDELIALCWLDSITKDSDTKVWIEAVKQNIFFPGMTALGEIGENFQQLRQEAERMLLLGYPAWEKYHYESGTC